MNLRQFESWALAQGQVGNPGTGSYPGQCVSLVQQYLNKMWDIPYQARGNAKDWAVNVPAGFTKLPASTSLQPGDIIVYGANHGGGYGHIAIIDADGHILQQNHTIKLHITVDQTFPRDYVCVLRHNGGVDVGASPAPSTFTVRVDKDVANVRSQPNTKSALAGSRFLNKGATFQAVGTVSGESINGNAIWYKSAKGNFVWSGGLTRV